MTLEANPISTTTPAPAVGSAAPRGPLARLLWTLIRGYQMLRAGRPSPCRFDPTCSAYALDAITLHGSLRGAMLAARRIGRCHPWGGMGWDPVPAPRHGNGENSCSI